MKLLTDVYSGETSREWWSAQGLAISRSPRARGTVISSSWLRAGATEEGPSNRSRVWNWHCPIEGDSGRHHLSMLVLIGAPLRTEILVSASWGSWQLEEPQGRKAAEARVSGVRTLSAYICPHRLRMNSHMPKATASHHFGWGGGKSSHVGSSCWLWPKALGAFTPLSSSAQIPSTCCIHGGAKSFPSFLLCWLVAYAHSVGVYPIWGIRHTRRPSEQAWKAWDLEVRHGQKHMHLGKQECLAAPWAGNTLSWYPIFMEGWVVKWVGVWKMCFSISMLLDSGQVACGPPQASPSSSVKWNQLYHKGVCESQMRWRI